MASRKQAAASQVLTRALKVCPAPEGHCSEVLGGAAAGRSLAVNDRIAVSGRCARVLAQARRSARDLLTARSAKKS